MHNVVVIYFVHADGIDELLVQHCWVDEAIEHGLQFLPVAQGSVHLVWFLLQRCHLVFDGLEVAFEISKNILEFGHDAVRFGEFWSQLLEFLAHLNIIVGGLLLYDF